jgi:hypothetical protein
VKHAYGAEAWEPDGSQASAGCVSGYGQRPGERLRSAAAAALPSWERERPARLSSRPGPGRRPACPRPGPAGRSRSQGRTLPCQNPETHPSIAAGLAQRGGARSPLSRSFRHSLQVRHAGSAALQARRGRLGVGKLPARGGCYAGEVPGYEHRQWNASPGGSGTPFSRLEVVRLSAAKPSRRTYFWNDDYIQDIALQPNNFKLQAVDSRFVTATVECETSGSTVLDGYADAASYTDIRFAGELPGN